MHSSFKEECRRKIVCQVTFHCQRKMKADYPSVAKACTPTALQVVGHGRTLRKTNPSRKLWKDSALPGFWRLERRTLPQIPGFTRSSSVVLIHYP
jgi:hypothetical protein